MGLGEASLQSGFFLTQRFKRGRLPGAGVSGGFQAIHLGLELGIALQDGCELPFRLLQTGRDFGRRRLFLTQRLDLCRGTGVVSGRTIE